MGSKISISRPPTSTCKNRSAGPEVVPHNSQSSIMMNWYGGYYLMGTGQSQYLCKSVAKATITSIMSRLLDSWSQN